MFHRQIFRVLLLLLALTAVARAAGRLTVTPSEPCTVYIDGMAEGMAMGGQRVAINHVTAGSRAIELRATDGTVLFHGTIEVPDGAQVTATFDRSTGLVVTSAEGSVAGATAKSEAAPYGEGGLAPQPDVSSFDMNEGSVISQGSSSGGYAGNYTAWSSSVSTVGQAIGTTARVAVPGASLAGSAATATASAAYSTVAQAEAGGLDAVRRSSSGSSSFQQGRPTPPAAVVGHVEFTNPDAFPFLVFLEGFVIADFSKGQTKQKVKLEVGRHEVEIWDATTNQKVYRGVLKIDEGFTVQVELSPARPPVATNRSWAWSDR